MLTPTGENMMLAIEIAPDSAKSREMMLESLKTGRARESMRRMLIGQGVAPELATALCTQPPEGCPDAIDHYLEVMGQMAPGKTPIKAPRTGELS